MGRHHTGSCAVVAVVIGGSIDAWRGWAQAVGAVRHHVVTVVHHRCTGSRGQRLRSRYTCCSKSLRTIRVLTHGRLSTALGGR